MDFLKKVYLKRLWKPDRPTLDRMIRVYHIPRNGEHQIDSFIFRNRGDIDWRSMLQIVNIEIILPDFKRLSIYNGYSKKYVHGTWDEMLKYLLDTFNVMYTQEKITQETAIRDLYQEKVDKANEMFRSKVDNEEPT